MGTIRSITPAEAARRLAGTAHLDPRGLAVEGDIPGLCADGRCIELLDEVGGSTVVVYTVSNGVHWVQAAVGRGELDQSDAIDAAMVQLGARSIAFQTARAGLVAKGQRLGYRVSGHIMRRDL